MQASDEYISAPAGAHARALHASAAAPEAGSDRLSAHAAAAPAPAAQARGAEVLFVQRAARAELAFDDASPDTTAVLTLSGVAPHTIWCATRGPGNSA